MNFHILFLIVGVIMIAGTLWSLRGERIRPEYSVSWLAVGTVISLVAAFPAGIENVAGVFKTDPQLLFLGVAGALISALIFDISRVVSKLRDENVILTQRLAILEYELNRFKEGDGQKEQD